MNVLVRGIGGVELGASITEYVIVICEHFADAIGELVDTFRRDFDPFIRASMRQSIKQLQDELIRSGIELAQLRDGKHPEINWKRTVAEKGGRLMLNGQGEDVIAEVIFTFGSVSVGVDFIVAHPATRYLGSIMHVANSIGPEEEERAHELLKEHATSEQYRMYQLTGALIHESAETSRLYVIRRGFPTLVYDFVLGEEGQRLVTFKLGLCAHLEGYPRGHFVGNLCPTDDVIAHLLLLRVNEDAFWEQCNVHLPISGLLGF